uniref:Plectin/eS10 N-terminal domain-containing protein n=1 Tax=Salix viminalis TaxID=40686 RepID=A0A6N2N6U6_SALVM
MIISEKNRREISKYLFQEGVCYAKKDYNLAKHPEIDVPNLQVIKLMQSFKSKEYVRETFAWMYYYWYLTNDGIEFLRTYLNLPSEIVPATLKKQAKPAGGRPFDLVTVMVIVGAREGVKVVRREELQQITSLHLGALVEGLVLVVEEEVMVLVLVKLALLTLLEGVNCLLQFCCVY